VPLESVTIFLSVLWNELSVRAVALCFWGYQMNNNINNINLRYSRRIKILHGKLCPPGGITIYSAKPAKSLSTQ